LGFVNVLRVKPLAGFSARSEYPIIPNYSEAQEDRWEKRVEFGFLCCEEAWIMVHRSLPEITWLYCSNKSPTIAGE